MTPVGLKPPPKRAPRRLRSTADLRTLQRLMTHALVRPLAPGDRLQRRWIDGRPMAEVAASFIKPNDRLTAFERLEIYNRMYWYRLIGCARDDHPALEAFLGERRFGRLLRAYLAKYPSRSFTLRNLCSRLPGFIREEPRWTRPRTAGAAEIASFEWAQTVAFDDVARPALDAREVARAAPGRLRPALQPYLSLLELEFHADDYVAAVRRRNALRAEASNAVDGPGRRRGPARPAPRLRRGRIRVAVHRLGGRVYHKRLEKAEFLVLRALGEGRPLPRALAAAGRGLRPERVREWFETWAKLGWLCRRRG